MSEEHDPIDINNYFLNPGRWRIRYYKNEVDPEWREVVHAFDEPTALKDLMIDGYKIGSCWQMR